MVRAARIDRTAELTPALAPEPESDRTAELSLDCAPPPAHGMASSPRVEALRTSTEAERSLRRQAEAELAKEMAVGRSLAAEVERLRAQLSSERSSGDGTAHPAESEPAGRAGRGGVLDHSLAALPLPALDHSLAAPPTAWPGASAAGEGEDASGSPVIRGSRRRRVRGERGLGGSRLSQSLDVASLASLSMQGLTPPPQYPPAPEPEPAEGPGAGLLSLRVNVVDETFTLPSLGPRQPYHGTYAPAAKHPLPKAQHPRCHKISFNTGVKMTVQVSS
eukprot:COSAG04_NODE_172_length_21594_cov_14.638614_20_plen_277_part_00